MKHKFSVMITTLFFIICLCASVQSTDETSLEAMDTATAKYLGLKAVKGDHSVWGELFSLSASHIHTMKEIASEYYHFLNDTLILKPHNYILSKENYSPELLEELEHKCDYLRAETIAKGKLKKYWTAYRDFETEIRLIGYKEENDKAIMLVREETTLLGAKSGGKEVGDTAWGTYRYFVFSRNAGKWLLEQVCDAEPERVSDILCK